MNIIQLNSLIILGIYVTVFATIAQTYVKWKKNKDLVKENNLRQFNLINRIGLVLSTASFMYLILFTILGKPLLIYAEFIVLMCLIMGVYATCSNKPNLGGLMLVTSANIGIFYFAAIMGVDTGTHFLYFAMIWLPLIVFRPNDKFKVIYGLALSFSGCFLIQFTQIQLFEPILIESDLFRNIYIMTIILVVFLLNIGFSLAYLVTTQATENKLRLLNQKLHQSINDLTDSNSKLEVANKKINYLLDEAKETVQKLHGHAAFGLIAKGISHEIKNPLGSLRSWAQMLNENPENSDIARKASAIFVSSVDRLHKRMTIMLKYSKENNSSVKEHFNLLEQIQEIKDLFNYEFKQNQLQFNQDISADLQLYANPDSIFSSIRNLILNATQFTPPGGYISVVAKPSSYVDPNGFQRDGIEIQVIDTGNGILEENIEKIFIPFFTSNSSADNAGLGLAETEKSITINDGIISVSSTVGVGTRFVINLPSTPIS